MIDKFGRELTYLRVSLIDKCNLKCFYCMPHGSAGATDASAPLSNDELVETISVFAELGIRKVRLTGGEPLLRRGVPDIVRRVKALSGIREVVMTTNGVLLARFAEELKAAGLDRLNVSLDTLDRVKFLQITGADRLHEVLEGIEAAARAGLRPLKINAVLMKGTNDGEVMPLVRFAIDRGFDMRFIEWMPTAAGIQNVRENKYMNSEAARATIESECRLFADAGADPHAPARTYRIDGTSSTVGFISPLSNAFCAMCNRLRLKSSGMLKTCLHGKEDLDIRSLLRAGTGRAEIKRRIEDTVYERPKEHFLNDASVTHNDFVMTAIGG